MSVQGVRVSVHRLGEHHGGERRTEGGGGAAEGEQRRKAVTRFGSVRQSASDVVCHAKGDCKCTKVGYDVNAGRLVRCKRWSGEKASKHSDLYLVCVCN